MMEIQPNPTNFCKRIDYNLPLIGFYDAPDPAPFADLSIPQASIGTTDIAMRQHIPPDILGFTVTKSMFEQLCALDDRGLPDL